jgi:flavin-dependent dehydrogenase
MLPIDKKYYLYSKCMEIEKVRGVYKLDEYEVIVCGGGPAGVSVTNELTKRGHQVLLIDSEEGYPKVPKDWAIFGEVFELYPFLEDSICNPIDRSVMGAGTREQVRDGSGPMNWIEVTKTFGQRWVFHVFDDLFLGAWMEENKKQGAEYHIGEEVKAAVAGVDHVKVLTDQALYKCKKFVDASGYGLVVPLMYKLKHLGRGNRPYGSLPWYWEVNCRYFKGFNQEMPDIDVDKNTLALVVIGKHSIPTLCKANSGYGHCYYPFNEEDACHEEFYVSNIKQGVPIYSVEMDFKNYWENWAYPGRNYEADKKKHMYRSYKGFQQMTCFGPFSLEDDKIFLIGDSMGCCNHIYTGGGVTNGIMFGAAAGEYIARLLEGEKPEQLGLYDDFIYSRRYYGPKMEHIPIEQTKMNRDIMVDWMRYYMIMGGKALVALGLFDQQRMMRFCQGVMSKEDIMAFLKNSAKVFPKHMLKDVLFPRPYLLDNVLAADKRYNIGITEFLNERGIKPKYSK